MDAKTNNKTNQTVETKETILTQCSRCKKSKGENEFIGTRGITKTCSNCRDYANSKRKIRTTEQKKIKNKKYREKTFNTKKEERKTYNKAYRAMNDRSEYMETYRAKHRAEAKNKREEQHRLRIIKP